MLSGDSLVAKIFIEGLENASCVIVVISRNSLSKPWVAEELDAAVVKRIEDGARLIPIVLDGLQPAEVPAPIRHLLHESVGDTSAIDELVERLVRTIHGIVDKPALGSSPAYVASPVVNIGGMDRIDSLLLKSIGAEAIHDSGRRFTTIDFLASANAELSIGEDQAVESLEVLHGLGLVRIHRTIGGGLPSMASFDLTDDGLETYLNAYEPDFSMISDTVVARLAAWPAEQGTERDLIEAVGAPALIVEHVLQRCADLNLLTLSRSYGGPEGAHFMGISPRLRREARS